MSDATCLWDRGALLGEGPVWVDRDRRLYWVDIKGRAIHRYDPSPSPSPSPGPGPETGAKRTWSVGEEVGAIQPTRSGGFVVARRSGFAFVDLPNEGHAAVFHPIHDPEPDKPDNRFNDGKIDSAGRFWAGSMDDLMVSETGALYRLDPDLACRRMDAGYTITNGPAFSPDGRRLYHANTCEGVVYAFDLDPSGAIANRRPFLRIPVEEGVPDGMCVDVEGCLWVAHWGGWRVNRYSPEGESIGRVALPVAQVSSCVFGGPDLDRMYITTASIGLSDEALAGQPLAGGLFVCEPGATGSPTAYFAD